MADRKQEDWVYPARHAKKFDRATYPTTEFLEIQSFWHEDPEHILFVGKERIRLSNQLLALLHTEMGQLLEEGRRRKDCAPDTTL